MAHTGIDRRPTHLLDPNINTMILQGPRVVLALTDHHRVQQIGLLLALADQHLA